MRVLAWFSCGAASALAAKLAVEKYGDLVEVVYCDTMSSEHPDNRRFFREVEGWLGRPIRIVKSDRYLDVDDVIQKRRYIAGPRGALCTVELKKMPRFEYQDPDDVHVFGYTAEEGHRIRRMREANPELRLDFVLSDAGKTKKDCYMALLGAGIALPAMYLLGYKNNNCIGCVKSTSPEYWQAIRHDFPWVYARRVEQSRELGVRMVELKGERIFLDELPEGYNPRRKNGTEDLSCGPECRAEDD